MTQKPVVLVGETLIGLNSAEARPLDRGSRLDLTFAGAEVNVAIGLSRLGHTARWVSVVGDDLFGNIVLRGLRGEGVDVSMVQKLPDGRTAVMIKSPRPGAEPEVLYFRNGSAMSQAGPSTFPSSAFADAGVLFLSGITTALSGTCRDLVASLLDQAERLKLDVWFDPNHRRKLWTDEEARATLVPWLPRMYVLLAGINEGYMLTREREPRAIGAALLSLGAPRVVLKAGAQGSWFFAEDTCIHRPAYAVEKIVDPVGAGDAFAAGLLSAIREGEEWSASLDRGNAMGAICCQTYGDWEGLPTRRELEAFTSQSRDALR